MLFLQWEARDRGWHTRTPAHPPRAARAGHPRGEESLTRTGLRDRCRKGSGRASIPGPRAPGGQERHGGRGTEGRGPWESKGVPMGLPGVPRPLPRVP